jgi:hypothetical protein
MGRSLRVHHGLHGYTEQPKGTLSALDEFSQGGGAAPYHCVKK